MLHSNMRWLILMQLLLAELALCRAPPPPAPRTPLQTQATSRPSIVVKGTIPVDEVVRRDDRDLSAQRIISVLGARFQGPMRGRIHIQGNVSCEELLSASSPTSAHLLPRELLGLSLVPVLVAASCPAEARTLVLRLYNMLGVRDTEELLMEMEALMERGPPSLRPPRATPASPTAEQHLQAVIFNIQQLARAEDEEGGERGVETGGGQCEGWTRVNGTLLLGESVEGATGGLEEAVKACENLGSRCAGVSRGGALFTGLYRAVVKPGSRVVPSNDGDSEIWLRRCHAEDDGWALSDKDAPRWRARRSAAPWSECADAQEQRVYSVVEWVPVISTFYNLGTAVYYAGVNCSETAKERALMSAVDLGTDALMAVTGGTAGVAGYAVGAGFKTGVKAGIKYMLSSMKQEEDIYVNQYNSWEEGYVDMQ